MSRMKVNKQATTFALALVVIAMLGGTSLIMYAMMTSQPVFADSSPHKACI